MQVCSIKAVRCILGVVAVVFIGIVAGTGCSDKPENKSKQQLQQATQKALDRASDGMFLENTGDEGESVDVLDEAIGDLDSAIGKNRQGKSALDSAKLAKANLIFDKAQKMHAKLCDYALPITEATKSIVSVNNRIGDLKYQQQRLSGLIDANVQQISVLNELVTGGLSGEGLNKAYQEKAAELKKLNDELASLVKKRQTLLDEANDLQLKADQKLRDAQNASGDQRLSLSTEGHDLTSQSNHKQVQAQKLTNNIQLLQSNIEILSPLAEKLQNDLSAAQQQIKSISDSPDFAALRTQLSDVKQQLQKETNGIGTSVTSLTDAKNEYLAKADEIIEVFSSAVEEYDGVKSSTLRGAASEKVAVCCYWKASVCAEKIGVLKNFTEILGSVSSALAEAGSVNVGTLTESANTQISEIGKTAFENYDLAVEKYSSVSGDSGYTCAVSKRHIIALCGKLNLAEWLGEYEVSDKAAEAIETLSEKIEACDPDFSRSLTAKLLDGKSDFVPVLQIDNTEYYEGIRAKYQSDGWPKLAVDQREEAVRALLANLEKIEQEETFDRQAYESVLGQEKQRLVAALEKGFEEEAVSSADDPNSF